MSKLAHSNQATMDLIEARSYLMEHFNISPEEDLTKAHILRAITVMHLDELTKVFAIGLQELEERAGWTKQEIAATVKSVSGPSKPETYYRLPSVTVSHVFPPIPKRDFDYQAYYEGTEDEQMKSGWGITANEAVNDLLANHPWEFIGDGKGQVSQ